jgi:hypothetical protein
LRADRPLTFNVRNGDWEYQVFKADKTVNTGGQARRLL